MLVRILHVDLTAVITADSCHIATSSDLHILDHISLIPLYISLGIRTVSAVFTICKNMFFNRMSVASDDDLPANGRLRCHIPYRYVSLPVPPQEQVPLPKPPPPTAPGTRFQPVFTDLFLIVILTLLPAFLFPSDNS